MVLVPGSSIPPHLYKAHRNHHVSDTVSVDVGVEIRDAIFGIGKRQGSCVMNKDG